MNHTGNTPLHGHVIASTAMIPPPMTEPPPPPHTRRTWTLFAWPTDKPPRPQSAAQGLRYSGWLHEAESPWRVLTTTHPLTTIGPVAEAPIPYTGDEDTLDWDGYTVGWSKGYEKAQARTVGTTAK